MQTIKWGPPAWRLLFAITSTYPENPTPRDQELYRFFFNHLGNILPCIYCRQSYREFIAELPVDKWLVDRRSLMYFLYLIHNMVNHKLRTQGYLHTLNPPFEEVYRLYQREKTYNDCGWDFLYAVAFNYPVKPTEADYYNYRTFFEKLKSLLPYEPARLAYSKAFNQRPVQDYLGCRDTFVNWFYGIHRQIAEALSLPDFPSHEAICDKYEGYRAACTLSKVNTNSCRVSTNATVQPHIVH